MHYVLVLQWPVSSEADFDTLIAMEDTLEGAIPGEHGIVDGHDFGSGEMNIFVYTDLPLIAFRDAEAAFSDEPKWSEIRAAYRPAEGDTYSVLWPHHLKDFAVQ